MDAALLEKLETLRSAYREFYNIRNHPAHSVDFEDWETMDFAKKSAWADRLRIQVAVVIPMIEELRQIPEMKSHRPYHEIQSFFYEDLRSLETQLQKYGLIIRGMASGPPMEIKPPEI